MLKLGIPKSGWAKRLSVSYINKRLHIRFSDPKRLAALELRLTAFGCLKTAKGILPFLLATSN